MAFFVNSINFLGENIYIKDSQVITVGASIPGILIISSNLKLAQYSFKNLTFINAIAT